MKKIYLFALAVLMTATTFGQYITQSFTFGGQTRQYLLYIPASYDGSVAMPFVLVLHGLGDNMNNFKGIRFDRVADTANFIFAIPQALIDPLTNYAAWNSGAGYAGVTLSSNVDDVGFLNALIDTVSSQYVIDSARLYSTGFSMGGFMTNRLGCELNNRIAAIASVSGTIGSGITCNPARVVPTCHFHGTSDGTVAYSGNMFGNDAEALVSYWANHDHCDPAPSTIDTLPHVAHDSLRVVHFVYPNGQYNSEVEFYKVLGGVHKWLGPSGEDINYAVAIWNFFSKHKWEAQTSVTGVGTVPSAMELNVYPNPASGELYINMGSQGAEGTILSLSDITGRVIYKAISTGNISINTAGFAKGIYSLNALTAGGEKQTRKVCLSE